MHLLSLFVISISYMGEKFRCFHRLVGGTKLVLLICLSCYFLDSSNLRSLYLFIFFYFFFDFSVKKINACSLLIKLNALNVIDVRVMLLVNTCSL